MVGSIMNLISGTHYSYERRGAHIYGTREYTIIFRGILLMLVSNTFKRNSLEILSCLVHTNSLRVLIKIIKIFKMN